MSASAGTWFAMGDQTARTAQTRSAGVDIARGQLSGAPGVGPTCASPRACAAMGCRTVLRARMKSTAEMWRIEVSIGFDKLTVILNIKWSNH